MAYIAKFIGITTTRGQVKHRWECSLCRQNKKPECRFNLAISKDNKIHKCRFCGVKLLLKRKGSITPEQILD